MWLVGAEGVLQVFFEELLQRQLFHLIDDFVLSQQENLPELDLNAIVLRAADCKYEQHMTEAASFNDI